jgi:type IV secretory pathway VirB10-like protein
METPIAIFVGLLLLCLVFSWLFGREDERHAQHRQHYQTLNDQDAAANTKRDRADAARRRSDPDAPENLFKAAAQAKQQAALERQAHQLIRAEQRRQLAQARREEAAEKRRAKAQAARAKARERAARDRAKAKRERDREKAKEKRERTRTD